jgi:hypothetical protein
MDYEVPEGELSCKPALCFTSAVDGVGDQRHALAALAAVNRPSSHYTGGWVCSKAEMDGIRYPDLPDRSELL